MEKPTIITVPCPDGRAAVNTNKVLYVTQSGRSSILHFDGESTLAVNIDLDAMVRLLRGLGSADALPPHGLARSSGAANRPIAMVAGTR